MNNFSTTYSATIVLFIITILNVFGIDIMESDVSAVVEAVIALVSALWIMRERYYKGGITFTGVRK